jgi:hypothetical protein
VTTGGPARVEPWSSWVASRPVCHVRAAVPDGVLLDAFVRSARSRRLRVVPDDEGVRAWRGARFGGAAAEMMQLPVGHLWALLEVRARESAVADAPHVRELRIVCTAGEREPGNATKVARVLDDAVRWVESTGVTVDVLPWTQALDQA